MKVLGLRKLQAIAACLSIALVGVSVGATSGNAAGKRGANPEVPFERYFADKRGDGSVLRFNDFSGKIAGSRILKLLRSGNILGDRVLLKSNTAVYFPDGYIVSSSLKLDPWRERPGLDPRHVKAQSDLVPNPDYRLVESVENKLGRVCATVAAHRPNESFRLRRSQSGVLSLVKRTPSAFHHIKGGNEQAVTITSALDPRYLSLDPEIRRQANRCLSGNRITLK